MEPPAQRGPAGIPSIKGSGQNETVPDGGSVRLARFKHPGVSSRGT
jgi:hypothetical protein